MKFQPLGDHILVELAVKEEKTASGIFLPDTAKKDKPQTGKVIAVGQGKVAENGKLIKMEVKPGDEVMFAKYIGAELKMNGIDYLVISERDVYGIFHDEK